MMKMIAYFLTVTSISAIAGVEICKNKPISGYDQICVTAEGQANPTHYMFTLSDFSAVVNGVTRLPVSPRTSKNVLCKTLLGKEYRYVKHSADVGYKAIHSISCISRI